MFNISKNIITKLFIFIAVVILLPMLWRLYNGDLGDSKVSQKVDHQKALTDYLTQLKYLWEFRIDRPAFKGIEKSCRNQFAHIEVGSDSFFECNPTVYACMLEKFNHTHFQVIKSKGQFFELHKGKPRLQVRDLVQKKVFSVELENHCHEKYLPKKIYDASVLIKNQFKWDNDTYDIYIDKYYASELGKVIDHYSIDQMKNYCQAQGKILLESRYFDAATFFPAQNKIVYKHPYPWTKSARSFLTDETKLTHGHCQNAYVKDCEKFFPFHNYLGLSLSWMGIDHSLGSYREFFRNTFVAKANLKMSSLDLPRSSLWHRNGFRSYWNGDYESANAIEKVEQYTKRMIDYTHETKGVAFRCARIR